MAWAWYYPTTKTDETNLEMIKDIARRVLKPKNPNEEIILKTNEIDVDRIICNIKQRSGDHIVFFSDIAMLKNSPREEDALRILRTTNHVGNRAKVVTIYQNDRGEIEGYSLPLPKMFWRKNLDWEFFRYPKQNSFKSC